MTGRKIRALQVPPVIPYRTLGNFPKALYGTTGGTCSAQFFCPVMLAKFVLFKYFHVDIVKTNTENQIFTIWVERDSILMSYNIDESV